MGSGKLSTCGTLASALFPSQLALRGERSSTGVATARSGTGVWWNSVLTDGGGDLGPGKLWELLPHASEVIPGVVSHVSCVWVNPCKVNKPGSICLPLTV
jgi:hypothetical protein